MRIIAGEWRRRELRAPLGEATRPTADRTRETLFSMLTSRLGSFEGLAVAESFLLKNSTREILLRKRP